MASKGSKVASLPAQRLFVETLQVHLPDAAGHRVSLSSEDSHYLRDVLRLRLGDRVELGEQSSGRLFAGHVAELAQHVVIVIDSALQPSNGSSGSLTLMFALSKGSKNDMVCDWATELGCSRIIFWQSERSVVRLREEKDRLAKQDRLLKIARSAAQQSKQNRPPNVHVALDLQSALTLTPSAEPASKYVCSLSPKAKPLAECLPSTPTPVILVIGPEGDLAPEEEEILIGHGYQQVSLGPKVLRSELAAVTAIIATQIENLRS